MHYGNVITTILEIFLQFYILACTKCFHLILMNMRQMLDKNINAKIVMKCTENIEIRLAKYEINFHID